MQKLFDLFYECNSVSTDTRTINAGSLFICLSGERYDANEFAEQAIEKGARYVITSDSNRSNNKNIFYTEDTLLYLQQLANYHRKKFSIPIIGITGSNGKTSSKELINAVLSMHYKVLCTKGNLNNHIGVPLTLLQINKEHEIAIIEMGANKPGDIAELCEIAEPNLGLITNIGRAHLAGFGNFEGVLQTKLALYNSVISREGKLFYNGDDLVLSAKATSANKMSYGIQGDVQCKGTLHELNPFVIFSYRIDGYESKTIKTHLIGEYNLYNFLAAVSIACHFDVPHELIKEGLENYIPTNNRSQVQKSNRNTLIIDCYNANPSSMQAALQSFAKIKHENKIAILGDMLELGIESHDAHEEIIELCRQLSLQLISVGNEFGKIGKSESHFETTDDLEKSDVLNSIGESLILIKGSRGIGLERIIPML